MQALPPCSHMDATRVANAGGKTDISVLRITHCPVSQFPSLSGKGSDGIIFNGHVFTR